MVPTDLPPTRKRVVILCSMLLLNVGIAHMTIKQILPLKSTEATPSEQLVKNEHVSLGSAGKIKDAVVPLKAHAESRPIITTYTVKSGDTLSSIAAKFDVSVNTIRWANDLTTKTSKISVGDELTILPVTGVEYKVKKGDTLSGIAAKFDASQSDILLYNDIKASAIKVGTELVIPNAEPLVPVKEVPKKVTPKTVVSSKKANNESAKTSEKNTDTKTDESKEEETDTEKSDENTTFVNPIPGSVFTQGIHDGNGVDFGAPVGTTIRASAAGTITIAKSDGYNGGYGSMIVITHTDGSQSLYAHLSKVLVAVDTTVRQGEKIALSGNTGRSTGPHLHYKEINTGKKNTFAHIKIGSKL